MKKTLLAALAIFFASSGAWANSLTFQGVTFSTTDLGGGELQLSITNALNATGDWSGIKYLESFALNNVGSFTNANLSGFTYDPGGLSNGASNGCSGSGTGSACFYAGTASPVALTNSMVFDIFFTGGTTNFSLPHLKVDFWADASQSKSTGNLLSQDIPVSATPLPASWTMLLSVLVLGLGLMLYQAAKRSNGARVTATV